MVGDDGSFDRTTYVAVQIFDEDAVRDYAEAGITFNSHDRDLRLDFARVRYPDGRVRSVARDAVQVKVPGGATAFTDMRVLSFALPTPTVGSAIEFQTTSTTRAVEIPGEWYAFATFHYVHSKFGWDRVRVDPVVESILEVDAPAARNVVRGSHRLEVPPYESLEGDRRRLVWRLRDLPAIALESWMEGLLNLLPAVWVSSIERWETIDGWASALYEPPSTPTPRIDSLARRLTRDSRDDRARAEALFDHVQREIRYIQAGFQRGGLEPHTADFVLEQGYGDCKDQTVLLIALLRAVGIEAWPAFVNTFDDGYLLRDVPALDFSHAIVYVPNHGDPLWIDSSSDTSAFPGLHWTVRDRWAFVIDGRGGRLLRTPPDPPGANRGLLRASTTVEEDRLASAVEYESTGSIGESMKHAFQRAEDRDKGIEDHVRRMYPSARVTSVVFPDLEDPRAPFRARAEFDIAMEVAGELREFAYAGSAVPLLGLMSLDALDDPRRRENDFVVHAAFEWTHQTLCSPPRAGFAARAVPEPRSVSYGPFVFEQSFASEPEGIVVRLRMALRRSRVPVEEYAALHAAIEEAKAISTWRIDFALEEELRESVRLREQLAREGRTPEALAALARALLGEGKYEEAGAIVDEALALDPENGEAHYLRGLASAYQGDGASAEAAFHRARELGYRP